jgi:hypothetical protein
MMQEGIVCLVLGIKCIHHGSPKYKSSVLFITILRQQKENKWNNSLYISLESLHFSIQHVLCICFQSPSSTVHRYILADIFHECSDNFCSWQMLWGSVECNSNQSGKHCGAIHGTSFRGVSIITKYIPVFQIFNKQRTDLVCFNLKNTC